MKAPTIETLCNSALDAIDDLKGATSPVIKEGKRQAGMLRDQSNELIDTVTSRAGETAAELGNSLIAYTKQNPLTALLLAVGAGALLITAAKSVKSRRTV
jgi:hypothetical protein